MQKTLFYMQYYIVFIYENGWIGFYSPAANCISNIIRVERCRVSHAFFFASIHTHRTTHIAAERSRFEFLCNASISQQSFPNIYVISFVYGRCMKHFAGLLKSRQQQQQPTTKQKIYKSSSSTVAGAIETSTLGNNMAKLSFPLHPFGCIGCVQISSSFHWVHIIHTDDNAKQRTCRDCELSLQHTNKRKKKYPNFSNRIFLRDNFHYVLPAENVCRYRWYRIKRHENCVWYTYACVYLHWSPHRNTHVMPDRTIPI